MRVTRLAYKLHRYLAYLMFAQLTLWIVGGVIFAVVPFEAITKSGAVATKPGVTLPAGWARHLIAADMAGVSKVEAFASAYGPALRVQGKDASVALLAADGRPVPAANAAVIARFAASVYHGDGRLVAVRKIERPELRLGIVDELYGQTGVWQARFDDAYGTRLYFAGDSGEYLKARNDYWVLYDLFWRLHVMDYQEGENFNNWLLRVAAIASLLFAASGLVLSWNAARRALSRHQPALRAARA